MQRNKFNIPLKIQNLNTDNSIDHYYYSYFYKGLLVKKRRISNNTFGIRISKLYKL